MNYLSRQNTDLIAFWFSTNQPILFSRETRRDGFKSTTTYACATEAAARSRCTFRMPNFYLFVLIDVSFSLPALAIRREEYANSWFVPVILLHGTYSSITVVQDVHHTSLDYSVYIPSGTFSSGEKRYFPLRNVLLTPLRPSGTGRISSSNNGCSSHRSTSGVCSFRVQWIQPGGECGWQPRVQKHQHTWTV